MSSLRFARGIQATARSYRARALIGTGHYSTVELSPGDIHALDKWITHPPTLSLSDGLSLDHAQDLYATIPTRDGSHRAFEEPKIGDVLGYGHHLAFFHCKSPEKKLREDGTDEELSPPPPFSTRMWAGGKIKFDTENPLIIGTPARTAASLKHVLKKGFEKKKPLVFVTQEISFFKQGKSAPSIVEERQHVYIPDSLRVVRPPREGE